MGKLAALSMCAARGAMMQTLPARDDNEKPSAGARAGCRPRADSSGPRELESCTTIL